MKTKTKRSLFFTVCIGFSLFLSQLAWADCGDTATLISSVQGVGAVSPLKGEVHTIEAMVTASFQGRDELSGLFVQEEATDQDGDPASSEGLFVFYRSTLVEPGQIVRITGEVQERFGQTQLSGVSDFTVCDTMHMNERMVQNIRLPHKSPVSLEAYEGMLVRLKGKLVVTDNYNLGRFGEFVVSVKKRLSIPTQTVNPGVEAGELQDANDLNRMIIDDGNNIQNADPIVYPAPELSWHNTLRTGQRVKPVIGVLAYGFSHYRIHPTKEVRFKHGKSRPSNIDIDDGHRKKLVIASFNVQNYFNGDGFGGGFPTSRGADSFQEFERQNMKLGRALDGLDAAIIGIAELENDGFGDNSAIASLKNTVNQYSSEEYEYVSPGLDRLGSDAIAVGLLYQPDLVTPKGEAITLTGPPFDRFGRQPLAQLFVINRTGTEVMVVMNHFKSKSCRGARGEDRDQGDGQGCFNATRVESSLQLVDWLKRVSPTPHRIILGDLNSYAREDPVSVLVDAGYYNELNDDDDYTYSFQGQAGVLDYALYSRSLRKKVKDVEVWHINADEPRVLDYNHEFKSASQQITLFNDDPWRSSDHDPVYMVIKFK